MTTRLRVIHAVLLAASLTLTGCGANMLASATALLGGGHTAVPFPAVDAAEQYLNGLLTKGSLSPNQTKILTDTLEEIRAANSGGHGTVAEGLIMAYHAELDDLVGRNIMSRDQANTAEKDLNN